MQAPLPKTAILLDDDSWLAKSWALAARLSQIEFHAFSDGKSLLDFVEKSPPKKETYFYLDSQLGNGERGEDYAKKLFDLGYQNLFMSTGRAREELGNCPWIKDFVGKEPPWLN